MSAPMTRTSVTTTSIGVMVIRLCPMRTKLGMANAGIPSAGARCDNTSQATTKMASEKMVWRDHVPARPASRYSSGCIDDLVVRHVRIEAGLYRAVHHVDDRLAGAALPGRLHDHLQSLAVHRSPEDAGRQLDGLDRDLVRRVGIFVQDIRHV